MKPLRICVDFDGTIVEHEYPDIGPECPGAVKWLKKWGEAGAVLILWTMRSDSDKAGPVLTQAVDWLKAQGVTIAAANRGPGDWTWTSSPKAYANVYVDDAAFGCPLISVPGKRPRVDWDIVGPGVMQMIQERNA